MIKVMKKIAIIGGGASGMLAAIAAARKGAYVTIYEHKDRIGKKLLTTGNGKCNFTNLSLSKDDYRGNHPSFVLPVLESFTVEETLRFFEEIGLYYKDRNGYVYPVSNQASTILDLLRTELERLKVRIICDCGKIQVLKKEKGHKEGFLVKDKDGQQGYDSVIVAAGSKAAPVTGSDGSGYQIARSFGHKIIKVLPTLVQLKGDERFFKPIAGVRMDVSLSLYIEETLCMKESGELQLTAYGVSGIPIFQLSRYAVSALEQKKKVHIVCDFLPQVSKEDLYQNLIKRKERLGNTNIEQALIGILNKKLHIPAMKQTGIKATEPIGTLSKKQLLSLCEFIKECYMPIYDYCGFENAQVCQGGVATEELTSQMESKLHKGLYFTGEIVDIDGICGGYNLQWAWSSGWVAGTAAALGE